MERSELKLIAAGVLVGLAAGLLAARALYLGNVQMPEAGPMVTGPAAPGAGAPMGAGAQPPMSPEEQAAHEEINTLLEKLRANPDDREANVRLANITFDSGLYDVAAKFYEEALRVGPEDADVLTDLGIAYRNLRRTKEAQELLERAVAADPAHATAWFDLAVVRFKDARDLEGAMAAVTMVLELDAAFPEATRLRDRIRQELAS